MDQLAAHADTTPDKPAVIDDRPGETPRTMTFVELNSFANRIASGLLERGARPGSKLMWCGKNSLELVAFTHAARKVGALAVPLNYRLSDEETTYVVTNSDTELVWVDAEFAALFDRIRPDIDNVRDVVVFGGDARDGQVPADDFLGEDVEPVEPETPAGTMIYTSGTTGHPKGAVKTGAASIEQSKGLLDLLGYVPEDIHLTCGPLYHSGPGGFARIAHTLGHTVVVQHKFDAEDWLRLLTEYRATSSFSAPTPIRMICDLPDEVKARYDTSSMRVMVANAAPWSFSLKEAYLDDFPEESLWEIYGSTELGVNCVLPPADQRRKPGSCGKAAPNVDVALFTADGVEITEPDVPGELFVRASSVLDTYYKAEEKFAADHREGGWHTVGDIAYVDDEGYYFICDRKTDMIISGGVNIYPAEIEDALERHPGIYESAVVGVPDDKWGESVLACIVRRDAGLTVDDVEAHARTHLAGYKVPRHIEFVDEIPKTGSNKILKRSLRERFAPTDVASSNRS